MINCKIATKLAIVKTEHVIRNTLFIHLWLCAICNCSSCHCLIHDVMLCSQNEELYTACANGDVSEVKKLLSRGGDVLITILLVKMEWVVCHCGDSCSNRCVILTISVLILQSVTEHSALYSVVLITIGVHVFTVFTCILVHVCMLVF